MNTREIVDKENMMPMWPITKTECHSNLQMKQTFAREQDDLEYEIRTYRGRDPLEPYYNYVIWLEQNSKDDMTPLLEDILIKFKEIPAYKQDPRLVHILVKYISVQSNPAETYRLVYDQGLATLCSEFYIRWAEELERMNDFKTADQVFQLGINCRAQPEEDLQSAHLQFQLSIARRVLDGGIDIIGKNNDSATRIAPSICQRSMHSQSRDRKLSDSGFVSIENVERQKTNVEGCVTQMNSGRSNKAVQKQLHNPHAQICEGSKKVERPSRQSEFKCPIAIFEPPDPLKKIHYPKHLVYVDGRDIQLEEIRAAERARKESVQRVIEPMNLTKSSNTRQIITQSLPPSQNSSKPSSHSNLPLDQSLCLRTEFIQPVEKPPVVQSTNSNPSHEQSLCLRTEFIRPVEKQSIVEPKNSNPTRDPSLCLATEFIQPIEKPRIVEPVAIATQRMPGPFTSDVSIRDQSWYLRTDFVEPTKTVQPSEPPSTAWKLFSETHPSTESTLLKRKSEVQGLTLELEHERPQKSNEDEIFDFSCHSSKGSTSTVHHSPTASFTVNTRAAMNLIQKMWESPLAPRSMKISRTANEEDLFKMPTARKSEYCLMVDKDDHTPSLVNVEQKRTNILPKPESTAAFAVYFDEDTRPQTDYARLSSRKFVPFEDRLSSSMNLLGVGEEHDRETKVVPTPLSMPMQNVLLEQENKENGLRRELVPAADENDENVDVFDETCSTKAFLKLLPSSTPFSRPDRSHRGRISSVFNGSYIEENERPAGACPQSYLTTMNCTKNPTTNLSLILENSKEQGSSSGGIVPKSFS